MMRTGKYALYVVAALMLVLLPSCRRTKMCECNGMLYGKPEVLYFNVEHSVHCEDISRSGYERLQDTIFIRTMHNITCVDYEGVDEQ